MKAVIEKTVTVKKFNPDVVEVNDSGVRLIFPDGGGAQFWMNGPDSARLAEHCRGWLKAHLEAAGVKFNGEGGAS